jgi:hypothetical protein
MSQPIVRRIYNNHSLPDDTAAYSSTAEHLTKIILVDDYRNKTLTQTERDRLEEALSRRGETADQITEIGVGGDAKWYMVWPRNIPWKTLPYVSGAKVAHMFSDQTILADPGSELEGIKQFDLAAARKDGDELVAAAKRVVVWKDWKDTQKLRGLLSVWDHRSIPILVSFFDGVDLVDAPGDYAALLKDTHEAEERFIWNYKLNFVMICSRAIFQVAAEFGDTKDSYARIAPRLNSTWSFLANPVALYTLYRLRDEYDPAPFETDPYDVKKRALEKRLSINAAPMTSFDFNSGQYSISVKGTGSYPPFIVEGLRLDGFHHTELNGPSMFEDYSLVLGWLSNHGYADLDIENRLRLTTKGFRLLELLGPHLDDPDVLLRWRDPASGGWRKNAIPSIDRWMNRVFRGVKRRMASLPPAPVIEREVSGWKNSPGGRPVIHGFFKRIDKTRLSDGEFTKRIEAVEAASLAQPFEMRRFGIVRDSLGIGNEDLPIAFWVGVPIGIFSLDDLARNNVGPLIGVDDICEESNSLRPVCGKMLDGHWEFSEPRLWGIGRTSEPRARYFERATSLDCDAPMGSDQWKLAKDNRPAALTIAHRGLTRW